MQQLIYMSRPFGFDRSVIAGILESSRRRNALDGISGALICRADIYIQLLEGPVGKVENTFERILKDDRHVEVSVLVRCGTQDPLFSGWAMYHDPDGPILWSPEDVRNGVPQRATKREVRSLFVALSDTVDL